MPPRLRQARQPDPQRVARDVEALHEPAVQVVRLVRRARHHGLGALAVFRGVPRGHGRPAGRDDARPEGHERELRARQLPLAPDETIACWTTGCEGFAEEGSDYCRECDEARREDAEEARAEQRRDERRGLR